MEGVGKNRRERKYLYSTDLKLEAADTTCRSHKKLMLCTSCSRNGVSYFQLLYQYKQQNTFEIG